MSSMYLESSFPQVMSRIVTFCVYLAFMYCLSSSQIDLKFSISATPTCALQLNFNLVPVFQTMSDSGLAIPPLPRKAIEVEKFVRDLVRWGQDTYLSYNEKTKYSLRSLVVLGTESTDHLFFPETMTDPGTRQKYPPQNPALFNEQVLRKLNKDFPAAEIALLKSDFDTPMFSNAQVHYYLQSQLRKAVESAVMHDPMYGHKYQQLARVVTDPHDMYQGSRAVANLITALQDYVLRQQLALDTECNAIIQGLGSVTTTGFHQAVELIEQFTETLRFAGLRDQEEPRVHQIVKAVQHHANHLIAAVVREPRPTSFDTLRERMVDLPYDSSSAAGPNYVHAFFARGPDNAAISTRGSHSDAYVSRIKRRLQHAEEVALKHGAKKEELKLPPQSGSPPAVPEQQPHRPFGRGGGVAGSSKWSRRNGDKQGTAAAAVVGGGSPSPTSSITPNGVTEIYAASVPHDMESPVTTRAPPPRVWDTLEFLALSG